MNPNKENVKKLIADIFPTSKIRTIKLLNVEGSDNFIVKLYGNEDRIIFIKHPKVDYSMSYVQEMNKIFLKEKKEKMVLCL